MSKKGIFILSRPLSNVLDEGSKNLVYYLCKNSSKNYIVTVEKKFTLQLPQNIIKIPFLDDINKNYVESSKSNKVKIFLIKELFKIQKYETIHVFFTITKINALVLLFFNVFFQKKIILSLPVVKSDTIDNYFIKKLLKNSSKIVVMSNYSKKILNNFENNTINIAPLVDDNKYYPYPLHLKVKLKENLSINLSSFIIIIPGEYGRLKMNENMINIIKHINKLNKDCLFILSFRLKNKDDKKTEIEVKKALENCNVLFLNTVNNYHEYCAISDLAIFPAKSMEGKFDLPLALVELMAMGIPVLHSDIAPLNELYKEKQTFCLPANSTSFSKKIIALLEDEEEYNKSVEITLNEAERFKPKEVIKKYSKIYE